MKLVMSTAVAAIALICAAALVATPADAKKRVKKPAAAPAGQLAYDGTAEPRHDPGGPIRSGNWCWKYFHGYTTNGTYGHWEACR
jgi:hypothetical protein